MYAVDLFVLFQTTGGVLVVEYDHVLELRLMHKVTLLEVTKQVRLPVGSVRALSALEFFIASRVGTRGHHCAT